MAFTLGSRVFRDHSPLPSRYTSDGENVSPPLDWSGPPGGVEEYALICECPQQPLPRPFVHWLIYGIQPNISQLPEGINQDEEIEIPILARQGLNSWMKIGYTGPSPSPGDPPLHYFFRLFALLPELRLA